MARKRSTRASLRIVATFVLATALLAPFQLHHHDRVMISMADNVLLFDTLGSWSMAVQTDLPLRDEMLNENESNKSNVTSTTSSSTIPFAPATFFGNSSPPSGNHSIFYNVFISPEAEATRGDLKYTLEVIREQTDQITSAFSSPIYDGGNRTAAPTIYYNLIGKDIRRLPVSSSLDLRRMNYYPRGGEELTLQRMWEYCQIYPEHTVTYLHDKGSLSKSTSNELVRRVVTSAVLSEECRRMADLGCNICTYNFYLIPNAMSPGNMFRASCKLIRTMIQPKDWHEKRQDMFQYLLNTPNLTDRFFPCLRKNIEGAFTKDDGHGRRVFDESYDIEWTKSLALGRYANEVWAWRHPDLQPCVLVPEHEPSLSNAIPMEDSLAGDGSNSFFRKGSLRLFSKRWVQRASGRQKLSWFQAPGRFWETEYLYNTTVPGDHPFYSVFARRLRPKSRPQC